MHNLLLLEKRSLEKTVEYLLGTREKSISPCISIITASFAFGRETVAGGAPKMPGSGELGQLFLSLFLLRVPLGLPGNSYL